MEYMESKMQDLFEGSLAAQADKEREIVLDTLRWIVSNTSAKGCVTKEIHRRAKAALSGKYE